MSSGELLGLCLMVGLLAALGGAVVTAVAVWRSGSTTHRRDRRNEAYARWLAAHLTLSRASRSLVLAFRALANEPRTARCFAIRRDEARRARAAWCEARTEIDRAEADLLVWSEDPDLRQRLIDFPPVGPDELRGAIDGPPEALRAFQEHLLRVDERLEAFVRTVTARQEGYGYRLVRRWHQQVTTFVESIVNRLSGR